MYDIPILCSGLLTLTNHTSAVRPLRFWVQHRMTDSNRNLAARALLVLAELGAAMGPPIERVARPALGPRPRLPVRQEKAGAEMQPTRAALRVTRLCSRVLKCLHSLIAPQEHVNRINLVTYRRICCA